jgi:hypothetical protein
MKQGTSALVATALFFGLAGSAAAQTVFYGSQAYYGGRGAPIDDAMPPFEVAAILRSSGFLPLSGPTRRGGFYVVSAVHPGGEEGRVVIDAYTGRIARFIPASEPARASRGGDEMVLVYQGPTFPPPDSPRAVAPPRPPAVAARPAWPPPFTGARGVPRPPASVPNVASRTPSAAPVTPRPRPQAAPQKPDTAQAPPTPAPVETKPAAASPPLPRQAPEKAPTVQPTQPLPPVQTME